MRPEKVIRFGAISASVFTNEIETEVLVRLRIVDGLVSRCDVVPIDQAAVDAFMSWIH